MAKIQNVDYEAIPGKASNMRGLGQQLNYEAQKVYQEITNMHNNWYGKRYNSLVVSFNSLIPDMNNMLTLVVGEIPYALETVANNYSSVDTGSNIVGAENTAPQSITEIPQSIDIGMRFLTSEVENTQTTVSSIFDNIKELMNEIESVFKQVDWESEAADAFKAKFAQLKTNIVTSIENIKVDFVKLMQAAQEDIQNAENANTVQ